MFLARNYENRAALSRRLVWFGLIAIVVTGAALRLSRLGGPSFWIDEILYANLSSPDRPFTAVWKELFSSFRWQHHLPLGPSVQWFLSRLAVGLGLPLN